MGTVEAGLPALRSGGAGLVLLTMLLPGRDGWDFLSERRRDPALAAVPVIITTKLGVATPVNQALHALVKLLEDPG